MTISYPLSFSPSCPLSGSLTHSPFPTQFFHAFPFVYIGSTIGLTIEEGNKQELLVVQKLTAVREVAPWLSFHCNPKDTVRCAYRLVVLELWCKTIKGKRHAKAACSRPDSTIAYREYT